MQAITLFNQYKPPEIKHFQGFFFCLDESFQSALGPWQKRSIHLCRNNPLQTLPFSGRKNALPCRIKEKRVFGLYLKKRTRMNTDEIVSQGGQICSLNGKTG